MVIRCVPNGYLLSEQINLEEIKKVLNLIRLTLYQYNVPVVRLHCNLSITSEIVYKFLLHNLVSWFSLVKTKVNRMWTLEGSPSDVHTMYSWVWWYSPGRKFLNLIRLYQYSVPIHRLHYNIKVHGVHKKSINLPIENIPQEWSVELFRYLTVNWDDLTTNYHAAYP